MDVDTMAAIMRPISDSPKLFVVGSGQESTGREKYIKPCLRWDIESVDDESTYSMISTERALNVILIIR